MALDIYKHKEVIFLLLYYIFIIMKI